MATIKSPQMINAGEERREHTYTVSGNVNCCSHYSKQYGASSKKQKDKITQRSRNQTYLDKTLIQKDTCILIFITALFTAAKPWKLSKCPSPDEWIRKMWYLYTIEDCCCFCWLTKLRLTLCDPMDCSTPGFLVFHYLLRATIQP